MGEWKDNAAVEKLLVVMRICLVILGIAAMGIMAVETVLRLAGVGWMGYEEPLVMVVFWLYMLGAAHAAFGGGYPGHDIPGSLLKAGMASDTVKLVQKAVILIVGLLMCWWSIGLCMDSIGQSSITAIYGWPVVIGHASMAVGMFLSALFQLLYLIDFIRFYISTYIRKEVAE